MATQTHYLAVLKAAYDYEPGSEDEIAIKEDQILFLIERTDDDWWKVKPRDADESNEGGLVPAAYVEPAGHKYLAKALYDYDASAPGELSVKEDDVLHAFDAEDGWLLVQTEKDGGKAGFVPLNYVEEATAAGTGAAEPDPEAEPEEEEEEEEPVIPAAAAIIVPPSPPRPSAPYVDPAERVAASHTTTNVPNDSIQTWAVSEVDKKGKKKKGTLGVGNGSVFFASESDKSAVQKWATKDIDASYTEKNKHVHIEILGDSPINLHYHAGSKDVAEAIIDKLDSSKAASKAAESTAGASTSPVNGSPKAKKNGVSVHFATTPPSIISPREPDPDSEGEDYVTTRDVRSKQDDGVEWVTVLYDFTADGEDELSVQEGDRCAVLEKDGDDWWKVRNSEGKEGVVPASYIELDQSGSSADTGKEEEAAKEAAERKQREEEQRRKDIERKAKAAAAEAAEVERKRRDREKKQREEEDRRRREEQEEERRRSSRSSGSSRPSEDQGSSSRNNKARSSGDKNRSAPSPQRVRTWHDRTGQFKVDAEFLGFTNGKLRLHKTNGVVIEVPAEKMSIEDINFVNRLKNGQDGERTPRPPRALSPGTSDDEPLAVRRLSLQPEPKSKPVPPKKGRNIDWFEFFLNAGCDMDDCTRYASSFERDKIDESLLPDITAQNLRTIGLHEGDIIRVLKAIAQRKPSNGSSVLEEQMRKDEEFARKLQEEENRGGSKRQTASPGLFASPGGLLKNNTRRGRPQPSRSTPPATVDLQSITTASEQITRRDSPSISLVSSPVSAVSAPPRAGSAGPTNAPPAAVVSGFDDDAWTNRPSSTQPPAAAPTQPNVVPTVSAPAAPVPPPTPPVTVTVQPVQAAPATVAVAPATSSPAPAATTSPTGSSLARTTESDVFEQLARLSALRTQSPAVQSPSPASAPVSAVSPPIVSPPPGFQNGMGMGSSPVPMGQLQAQVTGFPQNGAPRGPFAPVPANQTLLQPLVPTTTGFGGFVPTRPASNPPTFSTPSPQPSFLSAQPTGFQPNGFTGALAPQATGFPVTGGLQQNSAFSALGVQPTGFQNGLPQQTGLPTSGPMMTQTTSYPGAFASGPFTGGRAFGAIQPNPTGFNPGFGQAAAPPPVPPLPTNNTTNNNSPANIFAQMKSGTFGDESAPQQGNKYDALRPQPTGWGVQGAATGYQNGYSGTFY